MKLTLKDRVLILNTVLPQYDTRANMLLKISLSNKIQISESDQKRIVVENLGNGQVNVGFKDAAAISTSENFLFTEEELKYLIERVKFIDQNGMFSEFTMSTYNKILEAEVIVKETEA